MELQYSCTALYSVHALLYAQLLKVCTQFVQPVTVKFVLQHYGHGTDCVLTFLLSTFVLRFGFGFVLARC